MSGVSRITLNKLFKQIRILIAKECENISKLQGEIEIDESYFLFHNCKQEEAKRIRGKRGRGAGGKTPIFFTHCVHSLCKKVCLSVMAMFILK